MEFILIFSFANIFILEYIFFSRGSYIQCTGCQQKVSFDYNLKTIKEELKQAAVLNRSFEVKLRNENTKSVAWGCPENSILFIYTTTQPLKSNKESHHHYPVIIWVPLLILFLLATRRSLEILKLVYVGKAS